MPIYNGYNFLKRSIESVAKQTLKDIELICIDDGSTDDSLDLLNNLSNKYEFIKIITQENKGSGISRNNGINHATGEYIAFLDADDEFLDADALERMYAASNINNADIISANLQMIDENNDIVNNFFYSNKDYLLITKEDVISPDAYGLPLSFYKNIFRRKFLLDNNIYFPDLKRGQDPPFLAKVITSTSEIPVIPVNLYGHHFKSGGGAESKVDNYAKKHDYITHYKLTFDILEKKGYFDLVNRYKRKLFIYLNNNFNEDNELTGFKIINDVFGQDNFYFEGFENEINKFRIKQIIDYLENTFDFDFFITSKNLIYDYEIWKNKLLSTQMLKKCFLILTTDSLESYKQKQSTIASEFNNEDTTKQYMKKCPDSFSKYITSRIDIKNFGTETNNVEIIELSDNNSFIDKPKWYKNELGEGLQIQSKKGVLHLKIKCINDGKLKIDLRGIDFRDKMQNRIPIYVNYESFIVNNEEILKESILVWHDSPHIFEKNVKDGEIVSIVARWSSI